VNSILSNTSYPNFELLIVDNGSNDTATLQYLGSLQGEPRVRVVRDERPFNYSALNNAAVRMVQGELLALDNNDLEVTSSDWLSEMVSVALQPGVGAVGARLWYPDNTLQHGGVVLGLDGIAGHAQKRLRRGAYGYFSRACLTQDYSAVTAACLVIRKSIYEEVGGLNEIDLAVAFNDVDFCLRVREAGYRNVWTPFAEMYHLESATRGIEDTPEKQQRFSNEVQYMKQRWGEQLLNDPAYNPNLTLVGTDFSLAWPPRVC
jgi:GT2 family glycosyltransferase